MVTTTPTITKLPIWARLGWRIHLRDRANAATLQYATSEIAASPKVACVQATTPAQCGPLGIAKKNGTCHISQMKLRKKEKIATLSSGMSTIPDRVCMSIEPSPRRLTPELSRPAATTVRVRRGPRSGSSAEAAKRVRLERIVRRETTPDNEGPEEWLGTGEQVLQRAPKREELRACPGKAQRHAVGLMFPKPPARRSEDASRGPTREPESPKR